MLNPLATFRNLKANRAARKAARKAKLERIRTSMKTREDLTKAINADDTDLHDQ